MKEVDEPVICMIIRVIKKMMEKRKTRLKESPNTNLILKPNSGFLRPIG
jgi:hypothetical protein